MRRDQLGEIGHDHDQLGLDPQGEAETTAVPLTTVLGQAPAGGDGELRREVLHQRRRQARTDDDPDRV
jgi:hypothetical protein